MEPKTQEQIRSEVFAEWEREPRRFTPYDIETEAQRRYAMQFPIPEKPQAVPIPAKPKPEPYTVLTGEELMSLQLPEQKWVIKGMIPEGEITLLSGRPGEGKSFVGIYLTLCITAGIPAFPQITVIENNETGEEQEPFKGFEIPRPRIVLYVDEENNIRYPKERFTKLCATDAPLLASRSMPNLRFMSNMGLKINQPEDFERLMEVIQTHKPEVIVFDSFYDIHTAEENSAKEMGMIYSILKKIIYAYGKDGSPISIVLIHHNRKLGPLEKVGQESARGSVAISGMVGSQIMVAGKELENTTGIEVELTQVKTRDAKKFAAFRANIEDNLEETRTHVEYMGEINKKKKALIENSEKILQILSDGTAWTMAKLMTGMKKTSNPLNDALAYLVKEGKVKKIKLLNDNKRLVNHWQIAEVNVETLF